MKIEKLTDNKIRIVLNIDELAAKNIDFFSLTKNTDVAQKLFKKILKQAEKEVDFHTDNSKLLIEAFVSSEGFFIVTFTKLPGESHTQIGNSVKLKMRKNSSHLSSNNAVYEFDSFDDFCSFCTYTENFSFGNFKNLAKKTSLYKYENKYFLTLTDINVDFKNISSFYTIISEFAKLCSNSSIFCSKLSEYGDVIFKTNAIKNASTVFKDPT